MERSGAGVQEHQVLADGGVRVVNAIDDRDLKRKLLVTETDGERLAVGQSGWHGVDQGERRIGSRADLSVQQEGELGSRVLFVRADEMSVRGSRGELLRVEACGGLKGNGPRDEVVG